MWIHYLEDMTQGYKNRKKQCVETVRCTQNPESYGKINKQEKEKD